MKRISREPETYVERRYGGLLMKKKFLSLMMIMVMAFGVFALTGCGGSDDSAESDTLVVGLDDTFAPMGFRDEEGNLVGFDIDLANAVGEELADLAIGTQVESSALQMLEANEAYDSFKDNISEYDTYDTAIMDLRAGRVDVIAVDQVLGEYTNNNLGGEMKECTYSLGDDYYVIGFAKDNTDLRDSVNDAIQALIDDGTAAQISEDWFGRNIVVFEPLDE